MPSLPLELNRGFRPRETHLLAAPPARAQMESETGMGFKFTFSGSAYFDRMRKKGLYTIDLKEIERRGDQVGLTGIFSK